MIKARPVAGEQQEAGRLMETLRPFTYRRYVDFSAIESLRSMKQMIQQEVKRRRLHNDVKLGSGGIREIEFIAQRLQRTLVQLHTATAMAVILLADIGGEHNGEQVDEVGGTLPDNIVAVAAQLHKVAKLLALPPVDLIVVEDLGAPADNIRKRRHERKALIVIVYSGSHSVCNNAHDTRTLGVVSQPPSEAQFRGAHQACRAAREKNKDTKGEHNL